jgi:hypothetical protein
MNHVPLSDIGPHTSHNNVNLRDEDEMSEYMEALAQAVSGMRILHHVTRVVDVMLTPPV